MADLRPMEFGEILDGALSLFRRHFGLFLKLSLTVMWVPIAFGLYFRARFFGLEAAPPEQTMAILQSELVPVLLWGLVLGVFYLCAMLLLTAGSIRIISDSYLGREPQFGDVWRLGFGKIVPLFLVGLGKSLLILLVGMLCAVVFGVTIGIGKGLGAVVVLLFLAELVGSVWLVLYIACGYMVTTPAVVLESLASAFDSFGRSWELTRGARLRMLGLAVVGWLISSLLPAIVAQAVGALVVEMIPSGQLAWSLVASVFPIVLAPILPCILTLAYYDLRVRREGFDLQLLSEQLG
jgi:hypothetical protein